MFLPPKTVDADGPVGFGREENSEVLLRRLIIQFDWNVVCEKVILPSQRELDEDVVIDCHSRTSVCGGKFGVGDFLRV